MKKDIAEKWVAALRSGSYKQGRPGDLKDKEGNYCCLGVLCEILGAEESVGIGGSKFKSVYEERFLSSSYLSPGLRDLAGMKTSDGFLSTLPNNRTLAALNDGDYEPRKSFLELSNIIEKEWESL